jgi:hypothetical protein
MGNCLGNCVGGSKKPIKKEPAVPVTMTLPEAKPVSAVSVTTAQPEAAHITIPEPSLTANQDAMLSPLRTASPAATRRSVPESVFPADMPKGHVVENGDIATWSLVVRDGTYFAVSAAHCALLFGGSADRTFVPLPQSVLRCGVVSVRFLVSPSSPTEFTANLIKCEYDFVAVELKEKPAAMEIKGIPSSNVVPEAATWPESVLSRTNTIGCSVIGVTNAFPVKGVSGSFCLTYDGNPCFVRAVDADGTTLTWKVSPTDYLRLEPHATPAEEAASETATAQVFAKDLPGCDYDNIVKLSREYSCGRGEVVGVLLNVATLHRPDRTMLEAIQNGWVGPADVANSEARWLLQVLLDTPRVDFQLEALDGLSRIGPAVGSTGVLLICHFANRGSDLHWRKNGLDPAAAARAFEVLPQLVTQGCSGDTGSCKVVLETARKALSRGSCWDVQTAATAAIQKISDAVHGISASSMDPLDPSNACDPCPSCGKNGHLEAACPQRRAAQAIQRVNAWDRRNCFRCNKPGHWSATCTGHL